MFSIVGLVLGIGVVLGSLNFMLIYSLYFYFQYKQKIKYLKSKLNDFSLVDSIDGKLYCFRDQKSFGNSASNGNNGNNNDRDIQMLQAIEDASESSGDPNCCLKWFLEYFSPFRYYCILNYSCLNHTNYKAHDVKTLYHWLPNNIYNKYFASIVNVKQPDMDIKNAIKHNIIYNTNKPYEFALEEELNDFGYSSLRPQITYSWINLIITFILTVVIGVVLENVAFCIIGYIAMILFILLIVFIILQTNDEGKNIFESVLITAAPRQYNHGIDGAKNKNKVDIDIDQADRKSVV